MTAPRLLPLEPPYAPELAAMMPPSMEPLRLFRTLAHNPRVLHKIRLGNLLDRGSLDRRERELVILRTCARCGSEYEWGVHVAFFASRFGLDETQVAGTRQADWRDPLWSPRDRTLVRLVDELHAESSVCDRLWRELHAGWNAAQIVELMVLVGFYHAVSFVTNGLRVEPEPGAPRFPADRASLQAGPGAATTVSEASP